ncbi:MAG: ATP-binding cassette domain-containing protein [Acidimicrobiales bacterium]
MADHAIEAVGLTKRFATVGAVTDLTLSVDAGEVVGFLGPNGAGKTTTLRLLLGLLRPSAGEAWIRSQRAGSDGARRDVAYVPGDVSLWPQLTGRESIELRGRLHGSLDVGYRDELFERFELDPEKRVRAYSKGNRQKVAIIAALATRAPVLLLDEPTAGLDPLMERVFRGVVAEAAARGQAVLLSSHILSEVEHLCARVAMIRAGRLVTVANVAALRAHVGIEFDVEGDVGDLTHVAGVTSVTAIDDGVRVAVTGSPAPLLGALAQRGVTALRSREASLEEIFMAFYDTAASDA